MLLRWEARHRDERIGELVAAEVARKYDRALAPPEIRALLWAYARHRAARPVICANRRPISLNGELRAADDAVGSAVATFIAQPGPAGPRARSRRRSPSCF